MDKIKLEIIGMSYSQSQSGAYALILGETQGKRRLPIIIGGFEAQAIAIELEKMKPSRPLTHDLFKSFAETFGIVLSEVVINKFIEGVFHAELVCLDGKKEYRIDARTSDAVALALRFHCPVFTNEKIMSEAGIIVEDKKTGKTKKEQVPQVGKTKSELSDFTLTELKEMLQKAVNKEEYEEASRIRDEINRRKKKK
ncbi:MAG: bifunctional nuclease family protein [Bacteroidales bacterium]|nr:bifunctional nuclease family protein [Bacteroidales bacterium]